MKTESGEGRYTQRADANLLWFDDDSNDYETSEIKNEHIDKYKTELEARMGEGKTTQEVRLMLNRELEALGGDFSNRTTSRCPAFINEQNYWLGSPSEDGSYYEWCVFGVNSSFLEYDYVYRNSRYGLRPVVIVLKSYI